MSKSKKPNLVPENYVRLEGSERRPSPTTKLIGSADENETLSVTIVLRRRTDGEPVPDYDYFLKTPPSQRRRLPKDEFAAKYGAHPDEIEKVIKFARSQGLNIVQSGAAERSVIVSGTVAQMSRAFAVKLDRYQHEITIKGGEKPRTEIYRGREGHVYVPKELKDIIIGVFGLDNRHITKIASGDPAGTTTLTIPDMRQRYNFPSNTATGQTVAVFCGLTEDGDGYDVNDIQNYFSGLPAGFPMPNITEINVHGSNSGSDPFGEITQDIDIVGTSAPGADLVVYFTTHTQAGWHDCLTRIIHPQAGDTPCSVLTSSYYVSAGDDTDGFNSTPATLAWLIAVNTLFQDAAIQGITMCMCSGDNGTDARVGDGQAHVWYPASDPWALGVGGTTVGPLSGGNFEEWVWNDTFTIDGFSGSGATGGGVSNYFTTIPSYQSGIPALASVNDGHTGRMVPDVAANASPSSGYPVIIGGATRTANGTSSSTPLWAGLIALINAAIGDNVGFVNPALYVIGSGAFRDITGASGPSDNAFSGVAGYPANAGWDACTGWGSPNGVALLNALGALYRRSFYFVVDKSTFGVDEVTDVMTTAMGKFQNAFWLVLEGFSIQQVSGAVPNLFGPFDPYPGVTISPNGTAEYEFAGNQLVPQRIRFAYDITFNSTSGFPAPGAPPNTELLNASITIDGTPLNAETFFELVAGSDPYFTNVDPSNDHAVFYLSQDLRVFSVAATESPLPGAPAFTTDPYASLQSLLQFLNTSPAYTVPNPSDPLNALPHQGGFEGNESSVTPLNSSNQQLYNFAIARVRLQDTAAHATASNVRVFFRLFMAQSFDTDFQPSTTYARTLGTTGPDAGKPVFPLPSGGGLFDPSGNTLQTIPFFSTGPAGTHDYDGSIMNSNIRDITIPMGQDKVWAYYGCYLDVFNAMHQSDFGGTHHCLVAEIAYDDTQIINPPGTSWSPENSDKLAQRNLQITSSGNPSYPATHLIPQAFDMRPSLPVSATPGLLLDYPDELMIDWGIIPQGTIAKLYWPQIDSSEVIQLATKLYGTHLLTAADAHSVQCTVNKNGVTYIPIPVATGVNFAGLFTLDLPNTISVGMEFNVKVRRIASRKQQEIKVNEIGNEAAFNNGDKGRTMRNWRYITGTFQVKIPVGTDEALLLPEENTLAILKWRLQHMKKEYRWYPIIKKYIEDVSIRVNGFGGDAGSIKPSLNGIPGKIKHLHPGTIEHKGKVAEVVYNCFGDFEGFVLEQCCSERRIFRSHEKTVGELLSRACKERYTVAVFVKEKCPDEICEIRIYP